MSTSNQIMNKSKSEEFDNFVMLEKRYLECAICMEFYDFPRELPCKHRYCTKCLYILRQNCGGQHIVCPECRRRYKQPVQEFVPDRLMIGMLDSIKAMHVTSKPIPANATHLIKLPDAGWCQRTSKKGLEISDDGLTVLFKEGDPGHSQLSPKSEFDMEAVNIALSTGFHAVFYYEMEILEMRKSTDDVAIGFMTRIMEGPGDQEFLYAGSTFFSDGIEMQTGTNSKFPNSEEKYGRSFGKGDIVGCGLVLPPLGSSQKPRLFLTVNGVPYQHVAFNAKNIIKVSPFAGLRAVGTTIETNFGQDPQRKPFKYDIWKYQVPF